MLLLRILLELASTFPLATRRARQIRKAGQAEGSPFHLKPVRGVGSGGLQRQLWASVQIALGKTQPIEELACLLLGALLALIHKPREHNSSG